MSKEFIVFLQNARKGGNPLFSKTDRMKYLMWLDTLIYDPPRFNKREVRTISRYINRSIGFYLHLTIFHFISDSKRFDFSHKLCKTFPIFLALKVHI